MDQVGELGCHFITFRHNPLRLSKGEFAGTFSRRFACGQRERTVLVAGCGLLATFAARLARSSASPKPSAGKPLRLADRHRRGLVQVWVTPRNTSPKRQRGEVLPALALRACVVRRATSQGLTQ